MHETLEVGLAEFAIPIIDNVTAVHNLAKNVPATDGMGNLKNDNGFSIHTPYPASTCTADYGEFGLQMRRTLRRCVNALIHEYVYLTGAEDDEASDLVCSAFIPDVGMKCPQRPKCNMLHPPVFHRTGEGRWIAHGMSWSHNNMDASFQTDSDIRDAYGACRSTE